MAGNALWAFTEISRLATDDEVLPRMAPMLAAVRRLQERPPLTETLEENCQGFMDLVEDLGGVEAIEEEGGVRADDDGEDDDDDDADDDDDDDGSGDEDGEDDEDDDDR